MKNRTDFINGKILPALLKFVGPVFLALFLQAMYGAIDLIIVGKFAGAPDVSAVGTGSQIMLTITNLVSSLAMGMTILIGKKIGMGQPKEGGKIVGSGILLFALVAIVMTILTTIFAGGLAMMMHAPNESFELTTDYIRICGFGSAIIIAYNLIGSIFRGLGDSKTPLITVMIACVCNIIGDFILVALCGMATRGAAIATLVAQFISVIVSFMLIRKKSLPFEFTKESVQWNGKIAGRIMKLGIPIALQDLLVGISFLVVLAIVNSLGLIASAGVGVAEKVCGFIMLIPAAFMQSMSAFVAQNRGAGKTERAVEGLRIAIIVSTIAGAIMFYLNFFHGEILSGIFANDMLVINASADYLKAYAIDCLLTCFLFCFIGFFNGVELTKFVMFQGITGAFLMRIPIAFIMSKHVPVSLFYVGLATPCSTVLQIIMCFICFFIWNKKQKDNKTAF